MFSRSLVFSALTLSASCSLAAAENSDLFEMSVEELSQVEIKSDITSVRAKTIREQPGIVSVVTSKEIQEMGARDLTEVLMQVPGFSMAQDVNSMVGLTFRGLNAQEGKALLILDGIEVNDPLYASLPILDQIPADAIDQVEIIRGPGSAAYGGTASLSVIRVTTKGAAQNGGYVSVSPSYASDRWSQRYASGIGETKGDWRFSFNAAYSEDYLSNKKFTAQDGTSLDLTHRSELNPLLLDMGAGWKDLDIRVIYDRYRYEDPVDLGIPLARPNQIGFDSLLTSAKYELRPTTWLKITPQFTYRNQQPWAIEGPAGNYKIDTDRYQGDLTAQAEVTESSSLLAGIRYQRDSATAKDDSYDGADAVGPSYYYNGKPSIAYDDYAAFAQYDIDTSWVNVSAGGRYEYHDVIGGHFVPRLALTRAWDKFHVKALYSQAARIPSINVLNGAVDSPIEAEQTANYELESGYQFTPQFSAVGNIFFIDIDKPIVYTTDQAANGGEGYFNGNKLSSTGFEGQLRWSSKPITSSLTYSFYRAVDNDIPDLRGDDSHFLASPAHKITLNETWHITKSLDWNINMFWLSERWAYASSQRASELDPELVLNTFLNYRFRQFTFGVGIANLLDWDRYAPEPYSGGGAPLPLKGREFFAKITYKF